MTQTETLKLAISRLEWFIDSYPHDITVSKEDFLRPFKEALAQPEQEPVALMIYRGELCYKSQEDDQSFGMWCPITQDLPFLEGTKFYTTPPQPKEPEHEPVAIMPSNTRYTVEVEGRGQTYWDNIHDAITNAQRAVYSGPDNTTRALDDLKAGRIAEWSYGFSAVRIYPPQSATPPQRTWVGLTDEEILSWWSMDNGLEDLDMCNIVHFRKIIEAVEAKLKEKNT